MTGDIRALLARHLPGYRVETVTLSGEGLDNAAYEVNGDIMVRLRKAADPQTVQRETALLAAVRELSTLPVPEVLFADAESGVLVYRKLPGVPLHGNPVPDPSRLAEPLGRFLSVLHAAPVDEMRELAPPDLYPSATLLRDAELDYRDVESYVPAAQRPLVERFLAGSAPADPPVLTFCHNDLGSEHLLVDPATGEITGVLDWSDAAVTDPAHDFARIYRDLGPDVFDLVLSHYDGPLGEEDRTRVAFHARCALIEDLAYGLSTGPRQYADAALAALARTFA